MNIQTEAGIDGINFCLELPSTDEKIYMDKKELANRFGKIYANAEIKKSVLSIYINPCLYLRENNILPFTKADMELLPTIKYDLLVSLQRMLDEEWIDCDVRRSLLKQIECGITRKVSGESTCSDVINLLSRSFNETSVFQCNSAKRPLQKDNLSFDTPRKNYYYIKGYDKSLRERKLGNFGVEDNLLRIEVCFHRRAIKQIFGYIPSFETILQAESLFSVVKAYNQMFSEVIVKEHINPFLKEATSKFFEGLTQTDSPVETLARCRDFVVDGEIVRLALKKWYALRSLPDYSRQAMRELKKYELPKDVIRTIMEFNDSCL